VRLELKAIAPKSATANPSSNAKPPPPLPPSASKPEVDVVEEPCPKGLVMTDGKCAEAKGVAAYLCDPTNAKECVEQCQKGHAGSCGAEGALFASGKGGLARDEAKARELLGKACDASDAKSCVNLGVLLAQGRGGARDLAGAAKDFERGCQNGDAKGCGALGAMYRSGEGVAKDAKRAGRLLGQGCDGGDDGACGALGKMTLDGEGVAKDEQKAADLLKRACDGSQASACNDFGLMSETGNGVGKDLIHAKLMYQRACSRGDFEGCTNQGRVELGQGGNGNEAKRAFESACNFKHVPVACAAMKILFGAPSFSPATAEAEAATARCNAGSARDCATAGALNIAGGNAPIGRPQIDRACTQQEPLACAIKSKK
jgi:TPR repeat protein